MAGLQSNFWRAIVIRVDSTVKQGSSAKDIDMLLRLLDLSEFVQFCDATAILLMSQTGLRLSTVALQKLIELLEYVLKQANTKMKKLIESQLQIWIGSLLGYIKAYLPISLCES